MYNGGKRVRTRKYLMIMQNGYGTVGKSSWIGTKKRSIG
jgi:hypothetical protein